MNAHDLKNISNPTDNEIISALKKTIRAAKYIKNPSKRVLLAGIYQGVQRCGYDAIKPPNHMFHYFPDEILADEELVLECFKTRPWDFLKEVFKRKPSYKTNTKLAMMVFQDSYDPFIWYNDDFITNEMLIAWVQNEDRLREVEKRFGKFSDEDYIRILKHRPYLLNRPISDEMFIEILNHEDAILSYAKPYISNDLFIKTCEKLIDEGKFCNALVEAPDFIWEKALAAKQISSHAGDYIPENIMVKAICQKQFIYKIPYDFANTMHQYMQHRKPIETYFEKIKAIIDHPKLIEYFPEVKEKNFLEEIDNILFEEKMKN